MISRVDSSGGNDRRLFAVGTAEPGLGGALGLVEGHVRLDDLGGDSIRFGQQAQQQVW